MLKVKQNLVSDELAVSEQRQCSIWIALFLNFLGWWCLSMHMAWILQDDLEQSEGFLRPKRVKPTKNIITEVKKLYGWPRGTTAQLTITPTPLRDRLRKPKLGSRRKLTECGYEREDFWWAVYPDKEVYFFHYPAEDQDYKRYDMLTNNTTATEIVHRRMQRQHLIWNKDSKITGLGADQLDRIALKLESMQNGATVLPLLGDQLDELAANYSKTEHWKNNTPLRLDQCGYSALDFWWSWIDGTRLGDEEFLGSASLVFQANPLSYWPANATKLLEHLAQTWHPDHAKETGLTKFQHQQIYDMIEQRCRPGHVEALGEDPIDW